jgi:hypothetical protein
MTTNDDHTILRAEAAVTEMLSSISVARPDADSDQLKARAKELLTDVLDNGFPSEHETDRFDRAAYELLTALGYGEGCDPFHAHDDAARMIDHAEYDLFND